MEQRSDWTGLGGWMVWDCAEGINRLRNEGGVKFIFAFFCRKPLRSWDTISVGVFAEKKDRRTKLVGNLLES